MFDTTDELVQQIQLGKDPHLELKKVNFNGDSVLSPNNRSMADEISAMANSSGGVLVLGVEDKTKFITGIPLEKLDVVETWVRTICNDSITPEINCTISKLKLFDQSGTEKYVIRIDVPRSLFVHRGANGYFQRIGSSKRELSPETLARLFQQKSQTRMIYFDEQIVSNARVEDLEKQLWEKFKTPLTSDNDLDFLAKLKLISKDVEGKMVPTVSGILMATSEPQNFIPNAFIQAVAYRSTERNASYQLDAENITGPLDVQIKRACHFVRKNMRISADKNGLGRKDIPQYSMQAVFEAVVNAVAHRDYSIYGSKVRLHMFSDRMEIFSPGSIPNSMTIESLPLRQMSRNELITSLLARTQITDDLSADRRYIMDKRGEGVPIILTESLKLSGKKPEYKLIDNTELMLTIYSA